MYSQDNRAKSTMSHCHLDMEINTKGALKIVEGNLFQEKSWGTLESLNHAHICC